MLNSKKVNKTMKKIYQTPAMEVYKAGLVTPLLGASDVSKQSADENVEVLGNTRRTVNEDGLRDWNIDLW